MNVSYLSILNALFGLFILWQVSLIYHFKQLKLEALIRIEDINKYKTNITYSTGLCIILILTGYYSNTSLFIGNGLLLLFLLAHLVISFFIIQYKSLIRDLNYIDDLRKSGKTRISNEILLKCYNRLYKYLLGLYTNYITHKGQVEVKDGKEVLVFPESARSYLFDRFEQAVFESDLEDKLKVAADRKKIEEDFIRKKKYLNS